MAVLHKFSAENEEMTPFVFACTIFFCNFALIFENYTIKINLTKQ